MNTLKGYSTNQREILIKLNREQKKKTNTAEHFCEVNKKN